MSTTDETDVGRAMREAVAEIRREGYKAAALYAVVDAVLVALVANLAITVVGVEWADSPGSAGDPGPITVGLLVVVVTGVLAFAAEFGYRVRRPLVERFEAANPEVDEALRTARDAIQDGQDTRMARALYADVIDRLGSTSSLGLVHLPRLVGSIALAVVVSIATVHASVVAVDLGGTASPGASSGGVVAGPTGEREPASGELQPGDQILGEPENVSAGSENLSASVSVDRGGPGDDEFRQYEGGNTTDRTAGEAQRAGYAPREDVEDADLIREYNLRIREDEDD